MKKERLMIDMDDVITTGGFLHLINEYLNENYSEEYFKDFYMQDMIPNKEAFFTWFKNKNMYEYCKLTPNAYEIIKYLNEKYELYIGTSYIFKEIVNDSGHILYQKYEYLKKELPFISPYQYIFISNKKVLDMDIKIDDRIDNLEGANKKILFTAYHNKEISNEELNKDNIIRANNWLEVKEILSQK